jgi:hypothetical protein
MNISRNIALLVAGPLALGLLAPLTGCRTTKAQQDTTETAAPPDGDDPGTNPDPSNPEPAPKRKPPGKT